MLVDKENELMSDLLFTVHQHGGDDVTWKPPVTGFFTSSSTDAQGWRNKANVYVPYSFSRALFEQYVTGCLRPYKDKGTRSEALCYRPMRQSSELRAEKGF